MARSNQRVYQAIERTNKGAIKSNPYEVRNDGHSIELIHYGTKILELDAVTFFVIDFNPYSQTSNAAINTVLEHYGVPRKLKAGKMVKV